MSLYSASRLARLLSYRDSGFQEQAVTVHISPFRLNHSIGF